MTDHNERIGKFYPVGFSAHGGTIGRLHWINSNGDRWGFVHLDGRDFQPTPLTLTAPHPLTQTHDHDHLQVPTRQPDQVAD